MILFRSVPAIVGGIGGSVVLLLICLLALFCYRRRRRRGQLPVDLLPENDSFFDRPGSLFLQPQPYLIQTPFASPAFGHGRLSTPTTNDSRQSSELAHLIPASPPASATSWRSGSEPNTPRPIDVIQHSDAGPSSTPEEGRYTVELPPAYGNLQSAGPDPQAARITSTKRWI